MTDILMCGNRDVFDGILTCALSTVKRTSSSQPFTFHIFTMDVSHLKASYTPLTEKQTDFLEKVLREYNPQNKVKRYDVTELYDTEFSGCPNEGAYCSPYTLIRLLADRVELNCEKLLYLDADVLFNRDVMLLYDTDIKGYEYAAARDHYGKYLISPNYINAGVLLLNMPEIQKSGLFEKARKILRQKKLPFADQSALIRSTERKLLLPQRFNDQKYLHRHTVVRHFSKRLFWLPFPHTDNIKQWQITRVHKVFGYECFDDILYEYVCLKERFSKEVEKYE